MANTIGVVPEFTSDEVMGTGVVESTTESETDKVSETQETETPSESPTEEKPVEEVQAPIHDDSEVLKQVQGLQEERVKLLKEIQELRGQRREIKKDELIRVEEKIDDLKDINPEDVSLIDKVLKAKGFLTKAESEKMFYDSVKQEKLAEFLEEFPEYKPENDPHDLNWNALTRELGFYAQPKDPRVWTTILKRAHKEIAKVPTERNAPAIKQRIKTASVGSGGTQRSSSQKVLTPEQRATYERGGWSEEEIRQIESKL